MQIQSMVHGPWIPKYGVFEVCSAYLAHPHMPVFDSPCKKQECPRRKEESHFLQYILWMYLDRQKRMYVPTYIPRCIDSS